MAFRCQIHFVIIKNIIIIIMALLISCHLCATAVIPHHHLHHVQAVPVEQQQQYGADTFDDVQRHNIVPLVQQLQRSRGFLAQLGTEFDREQQRLEDGMLIKGHQHLAEGHDIPAPKIAPEQQLEDVDHSGKLIRGGQRRTDGDDPSSAQQFDGVTAGGDQPPPLIHNQPQRRQHSDVDVQHQQRRQAVHHAQHHHHKSNRYDGNQQQQQQLVVLEQQFLRQQQQQAMSQSFLLLVAFCAVLSALSLSCLGFALFYYWSIIHRGGFACWASATGGNGTNAGAVDEPQRQEEGLSDGSCTKNSCSGYSISSSATVVTMMRGDAVDTVAASDMDDRTATVRRCGITTDTVAASDMDDRTATVRRCGMTTDTVAASDIDDRTATVRRCGTMLGPQTVPAAAVRDKCNRWCCRWTLLRRRQSLPWP